MTSRIPGFYKLRPSERLDALSDTGAADDSVIDGYRDEGLTVAQADLMVENVISTFALPNAVAVNFHINGRDRVVPMVVEEPSVVAAVSNMARVCRRSGGFQASSDPSIMIGQIQIPDVEHPDTTLAALHDAQAELEDHASRIHPRLVERGGGVRGIEFRTVAYDEPDQPVEHMVVVHILLDCVDAMGANMVNTVCEGLAPLVERVTGHTVGLRILSNLADRRIATARVEIDVDHLGIGGVPGAEVARRIASAWRFAWADPYRAATHNKGVMNGIDAVCIATGNDWRAVEAGAHAYAARDGQYRPLTRWSCDGQTLSGEIALPLQLGTVGGPIRVHPTVQRNVELMGAPKAQQLAEICASVGLAQNLGALRALATEGIQQGHMRMHARTVAAAAGATDDEIEAVVEQLAQQGEYSVEKATEILAAIRK